MPVALERCPVLSCPVLSCPVRYFTALYRIALHCTALHIVYPVRLPTEIYADRFSRVELFAPK